MSKRRYGVFAWSVLVVNLIVVLWGAYVRATGSGAGCGSHWPLCNGEVLPRSAEIETLIEFIHRLSSAIAFGLVVALFAWALKLYPSKSKTRLAATLSLFFITTEALLGAGLVLFGWVAEDQSIGRVVSIALHLINTFLLLACISLTAWWSRFEEDSELILPITYFVFFIVGLVGVLFIGVSGAITALGDTLFPSPSLMEGIRADFETQAHFLIRLRVWHPAIAMVVSAFWFALLHTVSMRAGHTRIKHLASASRVLIIVQLIAGGINVLLLAPVWMQLLHLWLADWVWISLVLLTFSHRSARVAERVMEIA